MTQTTPTTRDLARRSQAAAGAKDRETWLSLFTPDAIVADPVGPSPFDPSGKGHRGTKAIEAFYDNVVAKADRIVLDIEHSYLCGDELADVATIRTTLAGGTHVAVVHGVFIYCGDGAGKLTALRVYCDMDDIQIIEA